MPGARLSLEELAEIALEIASGRSSTGNARGVGRPMSTAAREVAQNGNRRRCRAVVVSRDNRQDALPARAVTA